MGALDAPEVIRRGHDIDRKKRLLKWGPIVYFGCIWIAIIIIALVQYASAAGNGDSSKAGRQATFAETLTMFSILPLLVVFAILVFHLLGRNPLRGTQTLPEGTAEAPAQVRRLRSALESVSIATGKPRLECLVMHSTMPNALAVIIKGKPYLVVTSGLLEADFSQREMTTLVAHEAAHIAVGDALSWRSSNRLYFTLAISYIVTFWLMLFLEVMFSKKVEIIGSWVFMVFVILSVTPMIMAYTFERMFSRQDDLFADALAVTITLDPDALISAMKKVNRSKGSIDYDTFNGVVKWGTKWAQVKNRYAMPMAAAKYFFVNPLDLDTNLIVDVFDPPPSLFNKLIPFSQANIAKRGFDLERDAERRFYEKRLRTLEETKRGEGPPLERAGKDPDS